MESFVYTHHLHRIYFVNINILCGFRPIGNGMGDKGGRERSNSSAMLAAMALSGWSRSTLPSVHPTDEFCRTAILLI